MKYLCLIYEEEAKLNALSRSEWGSLREATLSYVDRLTRRGTLVTAEPLQSARVARTIRIREGGSTVTDGPFAETKEQLGGFFVIEAADMDEAVRLASEWPSARIGSIEVRPVEPELREERRYG